MSGSGPPLHGGCHCGNIEVQVQLSAPPGQFHPRACDCDYCRKHGAAWLSDPRGTLLIRVKQPEASGRYRQGSGQAELLLCRDCGVLVAVLHGAPGQLQGAVNVRAFVGTAPFGPQESVSPQKLSPQEKAQRWRNLWFPRVQLLISSPELRA